MLNFFKDLVSNGSGKSSKRFTGMVLLFTIVTFAVWHKTINLLETLAYIGAALLGLGILDKFKKLK